VGRGIKKEEKAKRHKKDEKVGKGIRKRRKWEEEYL
jgi:hypothetical protein